MCRSPTFSCCSLLLTAIVSLYVLFIGGGHLLLVDHLLLILVLTLVVLGVLEVLLFGGLHLLHSSTILGLFVDGLHVVPWRQHLVPTHRARTSTHPTSLLPLPFAFLATTLV